MRLVLEQGPEDVEVDLQGFRLLLEGPQAGAAVDHLACVVELAPGGLAEDVKCVTEHDEFRLRFGIISYPLVARRRQFDVCVDKFLQCRVRRDIEQAIEPSVANHVLREKERE